MARFLLVFSAMFPAPKLLRYACALWICFVLAAPGSIVICIGADGHLALEIEHRGGCRNGAEAKEDPAAPAFLSSVDAGCIDVSVSSGATIQPVTKARRGQTATEVLGAPVASALAELSFHKATDTRPPLIPGRSPLHVSAGLLAQRTVVLRI